jgi:hypothetical protein
MREELQVLAECLRHPYEDVRRVRRWGVAK